MRDLPLGNGSLLVNFDQKYQVRDIYFPHVGQENHSCGYPFRLGVWADGAFSWTSEDAWERELRYSDNVLVSRVRLVNRAMGIEIVSNDLVADDENIFVRRFQVKDLHGDARTLKVFLHHDFRVYENKVGDTAFYDPETHALVHYKKNRYFLINTLPQFEEFATGRKDFTHHEGTWRDAEDGQLHGGAITEGSVDSTVAMGGEASGPLEFYYWVAVGKSHDDVAAINGSILESSPASYFSSRHSHDVEFLSQSIAAIDELPDPVRRLYRRSLLIIGTQIDRTSGAIIAANDHDVALRATDHYSYLWPRDGAFIANAMDRAGYPEYARAFLKLCSRIIHPRGYFLQKYNPDGSVGSGWHSWWDQHRQRELMPIQEDETALVLWCAWEHCSRFGDEKLASEIYGSLILKAANFLAEFRDTSTGLPLPSWNLWEDRRGIHTFTCSTVVAGLRAAANFAEYFNDPARADEYRTAAEEVVEAMRKHLFDLMIDRFLRGILVDESDQAMADPIVDASLFGIFYFGCFEVDDPMVVSTMRAIEEKLFISNSIGGVARFENDGYMRAHPDITGNAWVICTLWLAEYYIAAANTVSDLGRALELLEWVTRIAFSSGVLAEQVDPKSGEGLSVSPLTWSHSTFIAAVNSYLGKRAELIGAELADPSDI